MLGPGVTAADFTLVPNAPGGALNAPVFGYEFQYHNAPGIPFLPQNTEIPMFVPFDRDNPVWWDEMLDELTYARVPFTLLQSRGCLYPQIPGNTASNGNYCPRLLSKMVDAVNRAGEANVAKFGVFYDTGATMGSRGTLTHTSGSIPFDLTPVPDSAGHTPAWYFWDAEIEIAFDTIPKNMWYLYNNNGTLEPVITMWTSDTFFSHQNNNERLLLETIRSNFQARYGMTPFFNLDGSWGRNDPSILTVPGLVGALNGWFAGGIISYSTMSFGGKTWGGVVPAFEYGNLPNGNPLNCAGCGNLPRNHGATFSRGLAANASSSMNVVEGFTDILEDAGAYRSDSPLWDYNNQYLDILRQYSDPAMESVKFQAESADDYINATNKPATMFRYNKALGIIPLGAADQGVGWALSSTTAGEALDYRNVLFPAATYKFTARVSSAVAGNKLHFSVDSTNLPAVTIPNTGNAQTYVVVNLGTMAMTSGTHTLTLTLDNGGVNVDWFFAKRQ